MSWQLLLGYLPPNRAWREATVCFSSLLSSLAFSLAPHLLSSHHHVPPHPTTTAVYPLILSLPSTSQPSDLYSPPSTLCQLERKRREYIDSLPLYFDLSDAERTDNHRAMLHQILIDVPRTAPSSKLFRHSIVQRALERILYIWALRHPASGYVQGINDLVTPFYFVFLSSHLAANHAGSRAEEGTSSSSSSSSAAAAAASGSHERDLESLTPAQLEAIEADAYWCLSKLIDAIQDHYTDAQPGIQRMVYKLSHLVKRIDSPLHAHFEDQGLQFIQFAFRWMNCFLMRELSLDLILRVWDTYLAEHGASSDDGAMVGGSGAGGVVGIIPGGGMMSSCGGGGLSSAGMMGNSGLQEDGFAVLHVYTCAALLSRYSQELRRKEFGELIIFLQHLPTQGWSEKDVGELLAQAFVYKTRYTHAHLSGNA